MQSIFKIMSLLVALVLLPFGPLMAAAPEHVDGATTISVDEAYEHFEQGLPFVDVRKPSDYDSGRIPGAVNLGLNENFSQESLAAIAGKDEPVVFYCNGVACERSSEASKMAISWGYTKVYYFYEGFPGWDNAGLPIE